MKPEKIVRKLRQTFEMMYLEQGRVESERDEAEVSLERCQIHNRELLARLLMLEQNEAAEQTEPQPRWEHYDGSTYTIKRCGPVWLIWYDGTHGDGSHHISRHFSHAKSYPSKVDAITALDESIPRHNGGWNRCDEKVEQTEPEPRWENNRGRRYYVRQVNDTWGVWVRDRGGIIQRSLLLGYYPSDQLTIEALDKWVKTQSHDEWHRCDGTDSPTT